MLLNTKNSSKYLQENQIFPSPLNMWEPASAREISFHLPVEPGNFEIAGFVSNWSETNQEARKFLKETQIDKEYNHLKVTVIEKN